MKAQGHQERQAAEAAVQAGLPLLACGAGYGLTHLVGWPALLSWLSGLLLLVLVAKMLAPRRQDVWTWPEAGELAGQVGLVLVEGLACAAASYLALTAVGLVPVLAGVVSAPVLVVAMGRARLRHFGATNLRSARLRGRRLLTPEEAQRNLTRQTSAAEAEDPFRPQWGRYRLPVRVASTHMAFVGKTGAGKTSLLRLLMQSVLPAVGRPGTRHRALLYDDKQSLLPALHAMDIPGEIVLLNPFDRRCRAWDIAADVRSQAVAAQVAKVLVPDTDVKEPFFPQAVRLVLRDIMVVFNRHAPGRWTFRDLVLAIIDIERVKYILGQERLSRGLRQVLEEHRLSLNLLASLLVEIGDFRTAAACWEHATGPKFSLTRWVRDGGQVVVLSNDDEIRKELTAINRVLFDRAMQLLLSPWRLKRSGRTWMILDELREAGRFDMLSSGLLRCRERDVCCVLGFQDVEGLQTVYGGREQVDEMLGQCSHKALLALASPETAEWASKVIGDVEQLELVHTWNRDGGAVSETIRETRAVMPAEFLGLSTPDKDGFLDGYFVTPSAGGVTHEKIEGEWLWPQLKELSEADQRRRPAYLPRPPEHQELQDWTAADLERLGLPSMPDVVLPALQPKPVPAPPRHLVEQGLAPVSERPPRREPQQELVWEPALEATEPEPPQPEPPATAPQPASRLEVAPEPPPPPPPPPPPERRRETKYRELDFGQDP